MVNQSSERAPAIAAFSLILLRCGGCYLLLRRNPDKRFAPGKWTGLGGRIEPNELGDPGAAALRELAEEAGLAQEEIAHFTPRRALLHNRPGESLTLLLAFTGELENEVQPACPEGTLHWVEPEDLATLELIDNAAVMLPLLIEDMARDPAGDEPVRAGAAHYEPDGTLSRVSWA